MKPRTVACALAMLALTTSAEALAQATPLPEPPEEDRTPPPRVVNGRVRMNFQDADLATLVRAISTITGRRFIMGGRLRAIRATIYSPTPVTIQEAYQAFLSALETNGLTVVPSGAYFVIIESTDAARHPLPVYRSGQEVRDTDQYVTRVVHLRYISPEQAAALLEHFRSASGQIVPVHVQE